MARRRAPNPAKTKADYTALMTAEAPKPQWTRRLVPWLLTPVLAVAGAFMLLLSFAPFDVWPLAYVALVPWTLALVLTPRRWHALLFAYISGLAFWAVGVYWIWWIDLIGFFSLVLFLGTYFLAAGAVLRAALARGWPAFLVLPVVWVSLEFLRAHLISGFPWFFLSQSQYRNTQLIQIVDIFGEHGLSVFVAMVNGALLDLLLWWRTGHKGLAGGMVLAPAKDGAAWRLAGVGACVVALVGMLIYGHVRLTQDVHTPGPVVGVVQQAYPIYLGGNAAADGPSGEQIYNQHLAGTKAMKGTGVQLVIWPESMAPPLINPYFLTVDFDKLTAHERRAMAAAADGPTAWDRKYSDETMLGLLMWEREINPHHGLDGDRHQGAGYYAQDLARTSRDLDASLLIGASSLQKNPHPLDDRDLFFRRNSVLLFDHDPLAKGEYSKIHLVPFGEYVPFKTGWPWLHRMLRSFVPPEMPQLEPGAEIRRFDVTVPAAPGTATMPTTGPAPTRTIHIAAPICYEGVFARECRDLVMQDGQKAADMIVNMSNDGWFVHQGPNGQWLGTTEQAQHLAQYVFRAIESRVPVVRSVNTGVSAYVDSDGRIRAEVSSNGQTVMVSGTLVLDGRMRNDVEYQDGHGPRVELDSRTSVYSMIGDVFPLLVSAAGVALAAWLAVQGIRGRKAKKAASK